MVTGASTCQLAIILIDARLGVLAQTRRHSYIASLLGIRNVVVAVNKMDLVDWSEERFDEICGDYREFAKGLDLHDPYFLPMSALLGDNVVDAGENLPWFDGPPLMEHLETVDVETGVDLERLRLPVQMVVRPDLTSVASPEPWRRACCDPAMRWWPCHRACGPPWNASSPSTATWRSPVQVGQSP